VQERLVPRRESSSPSSHPKRSRHSILSTATLTVSPGRPTAYALLTQGTETVGAYERGVDKDIKALLQPAWAELEARVEGLDPHGRPIHRPGVPSDADIERLEADIRALSRPLQEEEMDVEIPQPDGTKLVKRITLGSVLQGYKKLSTRKNNELEILEQALGRLDADISAAYEKLADESDLARAKERLDADLARFKQASKAAKDQLALEFDQARSEDKAASAETNEKILDFMRALQ